MNQKSPNETEWHPCLRVEGGEEPPEHGEEVGRVAGRGARRTADVALVQSSAAALEAAPLPGGAGRGGREGGREGKGGGRTKKYDTKWRKGREGGRGTQEKKSNENDTKCLTT